MQYKKLKLVLQANAVFSTFSGLIMVAFPQQLASWMNISQPRFLLLIGIGLLIFALSLIWVARQQPIAAKYVSAIIWQDWLWVIGSVILISVQAFGINTRGYVAIGVVALIVALFALLQKRYLQPQT